MSDAVASGDGDADVRLLAATLFALAAQQEDPEAAVAATRNGDESSFSPAYDALARVHSYDEQKIMGHARNTMVEESNHWPTPVESPILQVIRSAIY
jgi:hypothetical protein